MITLALLILPLRNSSRRPGRAGGFHLFLQFREIDFDQLPQLIQCAFKFRSGGRVFIELSLRGARRRHALTADDISDPFVNRRRQVHVSCA